LATPGGTAGTSDREISKEDPLSIFDTRGLEVKRIRSNYYYWKNWSKTSVKKDPDRHIHVAWVCIVEDSARVEDAQIHLTEIWPITVPVVVVITKAKSGWGVPGKSSGAAAEARNVCGLRALKPPGRGMC